jgi:RHH-type rel operon transcriptional repressor/antitoxin RelB
MVLLVRQTNICYVGYMHPNRFRGTRTMSKQTAIRLPDETFERLKALSERTGRTSAYYIREAIEKHIDDMEDLYLAEEATRRIQRGESKVISAEEMWRELDN